MILFLPKNILQLNKNDFEHSIFFLVCPYCHSRNTSKIGTVSKMFSAGLFGLGSKKIGKQWHCNSCGSDF